MSSDVEAAKVHPDQETLQKQGSLKIYEEEKGSPTKQAIDADLDIEKQQQSVSFYPNA